MIELNKNKDVTDVKISDFQSKSESVINLTLEINVPSLVFYRMVFKKINSNWVITEFAVDQ